MSRHTLFFMFVIASVLALAGCGKPPEEPAPPSAATPAPADTAHDAAVAEKEQELARREKEVADREAELAAQQAEEEKAAATLPKKPVSQPPKKKPPVVADDTPPAQPKPSYRPPAPIIVPAGTQITVSLSSDLSTKTAHKGDTFESRLVSDLVVGDRLAATAGSRVTGTVTDVISGSNKIGSTPTLGLRFDTLVLETNERVAINGELVETGKSEKGRDTAKIVGGAAAGAIIGHQIKKGDGGKIVGGLLGGAIGAAIAKNTGTEVELPAGSTLTIALSAPIEVKAP